MERTSSRKVRLGLTLKVWDKSGVVKTYRRRSKRAFASLIGRVSGEKYTLKVIYGKYKDVFGKVVQFINEGEYKTKKDLKYAFKCFTEKGLLDDLEKGEAKK